MGPRRFRSSSRFNPDVVLMRASHKSDDMPFRVEPSCLEALNPQITHINGMGLPVQNEFANDHPFCRPLHKSVTAKTCGNEQVLYLREWPQDRIVVRRDFVQSRPPVKNPGLLKERNTL